MTTKHKDFSPFEHEVVKDVIRDNFGLTNDGEENTRRLDQADAFVSAVNESIAVDPSKLGRWKLDGLANWWRGQPAATIGVSAVALMFGVWIWVGQGGSETETLRGVTGTQMWRPDDARTAAGRLVEELKTAGCSSTLVDGKTQLELQIDVSAPSCDAAGRAAEILSGRGLSVDLNGRATIVVPLER